MLLYVKCRIACAPKSGDRRPKVLSLCTELLETVKSNFSKVEAYSRVKDVIYLQVGIFFSNVLYFYEHTYFNSSNSFQAQIYHEIGNVIERNKCALEYRQIDEQYPTKLTNSLLTCF